MLHQGRLPPPLISAAGAVSTRCASQGHPAVAISGRLPGNGPRPRTPVSPRPQPHCLPACSLSRQRRSLVRASCGRGRPASSCCCGCCCCGCCGCCCCCCLHVCHKPEQQAPAPQSFCLLCAAVLEPLCVPFASTASPPPVTEPRFPLSRAACTAPPDQLQLPRSAGPIWRHCGLVPQDTPLRRGCIALLGGGCFACGAGRGAQGVGGAHCRARKVGARAWRAGSWRAGAKHAGSRGPGGVGTGSRAWCCE
jgi:hypothetical protein